MKLIILAAGEGLRMRPLTLDTPKPLLKILGKPIIDHIFLSLPPQVEEVIIVVRYLEDMIREHCGDKFYGRKITYIKGSPLGSAMSFLAAKEVLENEDRFLFIHGDDLPYIKDVEACLQHKSSCLCLEGADPSNHGVMTVDAQGCISEIIEKPTKPVSNLVNNGVMVLTNKIFECVPEKGNYNEIFFSTMLNEYVQKEKMVAVHAQFGLGGFTSPNDIQRIEKLMAKRPSL